jgi:Zn-dependent peptidase ImmA (M78 family)
MSSNPYEHVKQLAREKRAKFGLTTDKLNLTAIRKIYTAEGIKIDLWKLPTRIRAVYMCDDGDTSVLVNKILPKEPRLFAMVHELKHHFCDRDALESGKIRCGDYNQNREIEVAAEVFAAELIYPESEFLELVQRMGLTAGSVEAEDIVRFKKEANAPVSYKFLNKRFEFFQMIAHGQFDKVKFNVLEESLFGTPIYKQAWFQQHRARRAQAKRPRP